MSVIGFHLTCFIKHLRMNTSLVNKCSSTKATCFPSTGLARSRHNIRPENITHGDEKKRISHRSYKHSSTRCNQVRQRV